MLIRFTIKTYSVENVHLVCLAKNCRLLLHEVKHNVYHETHLQICLTDLPSPCLSRSGWPDRLRLLGLATSAPTDKSHATAPECQPPVCCFLPAFWHWFGSWLTPTRGCQADMLPNGAGVKSASGPFPEQDQ